MTYWGTGTSQDEVSKLRGEFERSGLVVMRNAFLEPIANEIAESLSKEMRWALRICDHRAGPRICEADDLVSSGSTAEEVCSHLPASTRLLACEKFAYAFCVKYHEWCGNSFLRQFGTWFAESAPAMISKITGTNLTTSHELLYTKYSPGSFLKSHSDGIHGRSVAVVANFTSGWHPEAGGFLVIRDRLTGEWRSIMPQLNTITVFDVRDGGMEHAVVPVPVWAPTSRYALSGWIA